MRWLTLLMLVFCACSTPQYVLHWRAPTEFGNFLSPPKEDTSIAALDGVALLYDRTRWVVSERRLDDGSAWVHYALNVKNSTDQPIRLVMQEVRLESANGLKAPAVYEKIDSDRSFGAVDGKTTYQVAVKFHVPSAMIREYGGSSNPIDLIVPVSGKGELRQKVWLWKE